MKTAPVYLVGTGVVGRAILRAHIDADVGVTLADQDADSLIHAVDALNLPKNLWTTSSIERSDGWVPSITLTRRDEPCVTPNEADHSTVLIESISERLDVKQSFFRDAEDHFGDGAILCSNTSTLRIGTIAEKLRHPQRFCGMHFFMPVAQRPAVEVVRGPETSATTISEATGQVRRIHKEPLIVADGPGFIVNRMLSPYLNEAMSLLTRGVDAGRIEQAALQFGMPLSPLELIDWIGMRTMFDAGRVFWQSFPNRVDPCPLLPALIKAQRTGRTGGQGIYDYDGTSRSVDVAQTTRQLAEKYQRQVFHHTDEDLVDLLSIVMWIESAYALRDQVVAEMSQIETGMSGGLGYRRPNQWFAFFDDLGADRIARAIGKWSPVSKSMRAPESLLKPLLHSDRPSQAIRAFCAAGINSGG